MSPALELVGVRRVFRQGGSELAVLNGIDLALQPGEIVALVGQSGAGKSTLLHIAGLLERPSGGEVRIDGASCGNLSDEWRTLLRRRALGFVYQFHHLLPEPRVTRRRRCWRGSGSASAKRTGRRGCRAASSSASPWCGPSPMIPRCCSPTSRPAISTSTPPRW